MNSQTDSETDVSAVTNPPEEVMSPLILELRARQAKRMAKREPELVVENNPVPLPTPTIVPPSFEEPHVASPAKLSRATSQEPIAPHTSDETQTAVDDASTSPSQGRRAEADPQRLGVAEGDESLSHRHVHHPCVPGHYRVRLRTESMQGKRPPSRRLSVLAKREVSSSDDILGIGSTDTDMDPEISFVI